MRKWFLVIALTFLGACQAHAQSNAGVCAQLQQSIQTLRATGGGGSQWEAMAIQQMHQFGCFGRAQQPSGVHCGHGRYCPQGTNCCANACCNAGHQCSRGGGCIPVGAVDCGGGRHCPSGTVCWTAPADVAGIRRGEMKCGTPDQVERLNAAVSKQREEDEARKRQKEEERRETARRVEEEKREAARRKEEEKTKAAADAKLKATAPGRQKVSDLLKQSLDKQREAELKKSAEVKQQRSQRPFTPTKFDHTQCQLWELAYGDADRAKSNCDIKYLEAVAKQGSSASTSPGGAAPLPDVASTSAQRSRPMNPVTQAQLDYLKRNAATLQPEQRKIEAGLQTPVSETAGGPQTLSTFMCGPPPNQYPCPPATIEAGRKKTAEIYSQLGVNRDAVLDRMEERHRKGMEYLRDSPQVKEALLAIQIKVAAAQAGGGAGLKVAEAGLLVQSFYETTKEFRQGNHYEGALRATNMVSSAFLDQYGERVGVPSVSSDALNLAGAASTAYLYGFFKGL